MRNWKALLSAILLGVVAGLPLYGGAYLLSVANLLLIHMTLALSWSLLLRSGQLSLGISGFFGLGVYVAALSLVRVGLHPLVGILLGGVMSGVLALGVGAAVLHLRGMYFAIVTLALAEAFRVIIRNVPNLSGGPEGMVLPALIFDGDSFKTFWFALAVAISTLALLMVVSRSKVHIALTAIRNDETVAQSSGVNVYQYLLWIFALTSAIQGVAGGLYAHIYGFISPEGSFSLDLVLLPIIMAVVGGATTTWGPVIGAVLLGSVSELLKIKIPHGHLLIYGVIIVIVVLFFPKGVIGTLQEKIRRRL
jgi:branched-chain amino acid transport system permease protein